MIDIEKQENIKITISRLMNDYELDIFDISNLAINKQIISSSCNLLTKSILEVELPQTDEIISYLKHNLSYHLSDSKKSNLGKYYTPKNIVQLVLDLVQPYIKENSIIMDLCAGCGAFLENFENENVMGRDIDKDAVQFLKQIGYTNIEHDNSLLNVHRKKYGLKDDDHIIIVGNPPYNDVTSRNKKFGKNAKESIDLSIDKDLQTRDYGISFLRAYAKLKANVICILHPLSYLIKEANFKLLNNFSKNYILKSATIFSSREFEDTQATPFAIVSALYIRGEMNYEYIRSFKFDIYNNNRKFVLEKIKTIDEGEYIRKYPPKKNQSLKSDIGLYMNNIRDINSLITKGYFSETEDHERFITIQNSELYKYAYLDCMKRYFDKDYLFGNLSPIVEKDRLENDEFFKDIFLIDTIINNQKFKIFNKGNKDSIIWRNFGLNRLEEKLAKYKDLEPRIYEVMKEYILSDIDNTIIIKDFIKEYFNQLKEKFLT